MKTPRPKTTDKQYHIIFLLFKYRFLTVLQIQKYFNHKDPHRIKEWLTDLLEKKYISVIKDDTDPTVPFIYCLATNAKLVLVDDKDIDTAFLKRLYKEKRLKENFINHCLFLFEIFLYHLSRQEKGTTLHFLTQQNLKGFDFLPEELPDAYIIVEGKDGTQKYFLDLFDEYRKPAGVGRFNIRKYITYSEGGNWQANTGNSQLPSLLFVVQDERRLKHLFMYGKAKLAKTYEKLSLFLTTQEKIKLNRDDEDIWKEVNNTIEA